MIVPYYSHFLKSFDPFLLWWLTVATILLIAAAAMSSPLGWPTRVMPKYFTLNTIPSKSVSLVSVQFSGSSKTQNKHLHHLSYLKEQFTKIWKPCIIYSPSCCFKPIWLYKETPNDTLTDSLSLTFCQTSGFQRRKKMVYKLNVQGLKIKGLKETAWNVNVLESVID